MDRDTTSDTTGPWRYARCKFKQSPMHKVPQLFSNTKHGMRVWTRYVWSWSWKPHWKWKPLFYSSGLHWTLSEPLCDNMWHYWNPVKSAGIQWVQQIPAEHVGECKVLGDLTHEQIAAIPKTPGVSYSRPIDPRIATESEAEENERNLVQVLQYHQCSLAACLQVIKGWIFCKLRAPFTKNMNNKKVHWHVSFIFYFCPT